MEYNQDDELEELNNQMLTIADHQDEETQETVVPEEWCRKRAKEGWFPPIKDPFTKLKTIEEVKAVIAN